jgi:hypothetical protein
MPLSARSIDWTIALHVFAGGAKTSVENPDFRLAAVGACKGRPLRA